MEGIRMLRRVGLLCIVGLVVVPAFPALASPGGRVAAARVKESSYRHYLDDELYTHAGDDRGFGPEHDLAMLNIAALFESFGLTVTLEPFVYGYPEPDSLYYNVVGTKLGTTHSDQDYVIGAHYDSVNNPGADDNASGVSLVLEAARVLSAYESEYTIRFVAFDREEQGLHGAEAYVSDHSLDDILGMISADMVAYNHQDANSVNIYARDASIPIQENLAAAVAEYSDGLTSNLRGPSFSSDHAPFEDAGIQAVLLIESGGNPYYHTQQDNVDMPNYIDYEFGANNTRSVVGFLVDHAGVSVDIPNGDYDGDGNVDLEDYSEFALCFSGEGVTPEVPTCSFFDFDSDDDVDCDDWNMFRALWTGPGDLPTFWPCIVLPPEAASAGCRCLAVTPPEHGLPMALGVAGDPADPAVWCLDRYVQADGRLGSAPVYQTYDQWGTVLICEDDIIPETSYRVWCDYGQEGSPNPSAEVTATTTVWGDTVGPYRVGIGWLPPDGSVDIPDVVAILDRFRGLPDAPPLHQVDLIALGLGCQPDGSVDIIDASMAVDGFRGFTYADSTLGNCPGPCP